MIILFRCCEAATSAGSMGSETQIVPRWEGKYKNEIFNACWHSMQQGIEETDKIYFISDRTSPESLAKLSETTIAQTEIREIVPMVEKQKTHPYPKYHPVVVNDASEFATQLIDIAEKNPDEIIYACEDDYLHLPHAILAMKWLFNATDHQGFYVPYDYPDRYSLDPSRQCEVFIGAYGHLRTIQSSTLTMAAKGKTFLQYKYEILQGGVFAQDSWTWKAFNQVKCLAPIPGHTTHLQDRCITPIINWKQYFDSLHPEKIF